MGKQTTRKRQYKKISKKRASRQRLRMLARRVGMGFSVLCLLMAGTVGWSLWHSGKLARWQQQLVDGAWQTTADAGFSLERIYLTGHEKVEGGMILAAIDAQRGDPILSLSLAEMKDRVEKIALVRKAKVLRSLPNSLRIYIEERRPVAIWQYRGELQLVDSDGVTLGKANLRENRKLPLLVGQMESDHIRKFFAFLAETPGLRQEVETASLVSERRWNVTLKKGIEIKLPEQGLENARLQLDALAAQNLLLRDDIQVIDLRIPDRLFIRQQKPLISEEGAQDT